MAPSRIAVLGIESGGELGMISILVRLPCLVVYAINVKTRQTGRLPGQDVRNLEAPSTSARNI